MNYQLFNNKVLADLLNTIDPIVFKNQSNKELGVYLKNLILNAAVAERKLSFVSKNELLNIRAELAGRNQKGTEKSTAQKIIAAVFNSDYPRLKKLLDENSEIKESLKKDWFKENQSAIAQKKRGDALTRALEKMVKKNPNITEREVRELLRDGYSDDIKYNHPEDGIYIESESKEIEITALKDRLSRVKKDLKKQIALAG